MARITFDNDSLIDMLDDLAAKVPNKIPEAVEAMADVVHPALISAAPYDGSERHKDKHLKEVITKTKVRKSSRSGEGIGRYITIFVSPRGIKGAEIKDSKRKNRARQNWDKDKHVFKLVVSEYGSSKQAATPWWKPTIEKKGDEALSAANEIMLNEVDKICR